MAEAIRYLCSKCGHAILAWSDGNPYYFDEAGKKQYAYHPDHERLDKCIGNDRPHLCLSCGRELLIDSRAADTSCSKCGATDPVKTYQLNGYRCPYCNEGEFTVDADFHCIS